MACEAEPARKEKGKVSKRSLRSLRYEKSELQAKQTIAKQSLHGIFVNDEQCFEMIFDKFAMEEQKPLWYNNYNSVWTVYTYESD